MTRADVARDVWTVARRWQDADTARPTAAEIDALRVTVTEMLEAHVDALSAEDATATVDAKFARLRGVA